MESDELWCVLAGKKASQGAAASLMMATGAICPEKSSRAKVTVRMRRKRKGERMSGNDNIVFLEQKLRTGWKLQFLPGEAVIKLTLQWRESLFPLSKFILC